MMTINQVTQSSRLYTYILIHLYLYLFIYLFIYLTFVFFSFILSYFNIFNLLQQHYSTALHGSD